MSAPVRVIVADRSTYRLDPYVRDIAGRFAPKPKEDPPPLALLVDLGVVQYLHGGALIIEQDTTGRNHWRVRTIRDEDGTFRVLYLED